MNPQSTYERAGVVFGLVFGGVITASVFYLLRFEINGAAGSLVRLLVLCMGANLTAGMLQGMLPSAIGFAVLRRQAQASQHVVDSHTKASGAAFGEMPGHMRVQRPWTRLDDLTQAFVVVRRAVNGPPEKAIVLGAIFPSYVEAADYLDVLCWKVHQYQSHQITHVGGKPVEPPTNVDIHANLDAPVWSSDPGAYSIVSVSIARKGDA